MSVVDHLGRFPPPTLDWPQLIPLIGPANAAVANYDGVLAGGPNGADRAAHSATGASGRSAPRLDRGERPPRPVLMFPELLAITEGWDAS